MYQPTTSSSSSPSKPTGPTVLTRFSSAPGAFLSRAVDSVVIEGKGGGSSSSPSPSPSHVAHHHHHNHNHNHNHNPLQYHRYISGDSSSLTSESTCKVNSSDKPGKSSEFGGSALLRQKSSPAGFLGHLVTENGFSITRGSGGFNSHNNGSTGGHVVPRLKSQLSFTRQDSLSQISEGSESAVEGLSWDSRCQNSTHSYSPAAFGLESWDNGNSIAFSGPPSKRHKNIDGDLYNCLNGLETQFSLPQTALEMATMDKLLNIPEDSVPCKIRAKRGFATHPRSIAERERRTRISGKLKKLQDLVPNMDKQTSYADMLDLAVQHINGLQNEVQRLHKELENCTCGCKQST